MRVITLFSLTPLLAIISAVPTNPAPQTHCPGEATVATFDDRQPIPLVPEINTVGFYRGIRYNSFDIVKVGLPGLPPITGLIPQSGDIMIVNGLVADVLRGEPSFYTATIPAFDLEELYFGCTLNTVQSAVLIPTPCTVQFTGVKNNVDPGGGTRTTITFQFNPENTVLSHLTRAAFEGPAWVNLQKIEVAIVQGVSTTLSVLFLDSIKYRNCTTAGS